LSSANPRASSTIRTRAVRADSTGRRNTFNREGFYGLTWELDTTVDLSSSDAMAESFFASLEGELIARARPFAGEIAPGTAVVLWTFATS